MRRDLFKEYVRPSIEIESVGLSEVGTKVKSIAEDSMRTFIKSIVVVSQQTLLALHRFSWYLAVPMLALAASAAHAAWTSSAVGPVTSLGAYQSSNSTPGLVLFKINPMPVTGCPYNDYFEISPTLNVDPESRKQWFAMLLAARQNTGLISVGYDSGTTCGPNGRPAVYVLFSTD